ALGVAPVYDYHLDVKDTKLGRIQQAFRIGRRALESGGEKEALAAENRTSFFDALDERLAEYEIRALAAGGFSKEAEDGLSYLVSSAMAYKIVATSRQLDPL